MGATLELWQGIETIRWRLEQYRGNNKGIEQQNIGMINLNALGD
jgi:hypothetical protein